jgi:hypothetical protein
LVISYPGYCEERAVPDENGRASDPGHSNDCQEVRK